MVLRRPKRSVDLQRSAVEVCHAIAWRAPRSKNANTPKAEYDFQYKGASECQMRPYKMSEFDEKIKKFKKIEKSACILGKPLLY